MPSRIAIDIATPSAMKTRPIDHRGYPVPYFVTNKTKDGKWDFKNISGDRFDEVVKFNKCWVSGEPLGKFKAFCLGPMGVATKTSGDAPVTKEIALWSVKICPYMMRPLARRDETKQGLIDQRHHGGSMTINKNPGVVAVWVTKNCNFEKGRGFDIGDPIEISWWREGAPACRADVENSIEHGLEIAKQSLSKTRPQDVPLLIQMVEPSQMYWPET